MSTRSLFDLHAQDLSRVWPAVQERFVCPICFEVFTHDDLDIPNTLSVGHIWPHRFFRERSEEADAQEVLLCTSCNSRGGHSYDAAMQRIEEFLESQTAGEAYMPQIAYIRSGPMREPIRMRLFVLQKPEGLTADDMRLIVSNDGIVVSVPDRPRIIGVYPLIDESGRRHYNVEQWELAKRYLREGGSMTVHPHDSDWSRERFSTLPELWRVGLLAASYLYAFYTFGYRYIFQSSLDDVRSIIRMALSGNSKVDLTFDKSRALNVASYEGYFPNPDIGFFHPNDPEVPHHMRIQFLGYAIWLPARYQFLFIEGDSALAVGGTVASATGHLPHDGMCIWENFLGTPDYTITNDDVVARTSI